MEYLYPLVLLSCLLLVALFAASEAALAATNRVRLRHLLRVQSNDETSAPTSSDLSREAQNFIATVTIAANVPLLGASCLALWLGWDSYGPVGAFIASFCVAVVSISLFQVAPRLLVSSPRALDKVGWVRPARLLIALLRPIVMVLLWIGRALMGPLGILDEPKVNAEANNEEIRDLIDTAGAGGALDESKELIESIFTFGDTRVHEVMIPRPDIVALPETCDADAVVRIFEQTGLSRLPLYRGSIDEVVGILHIRDVLRCLGEGRPDFAPRDILREPLYLPESQKIDTALASMRTQKTHLALVIDEFGGTAGLLTVEDILEELVGEIADEHDRREESLMILDERNALADARLHTDDLQSEWGLVLPVGEFDTVGGFMIEKMGRELRVGDRLELPEATLIVHSTRGRRPHRIHIVRPEAPPSVDGTVA